MRVRFTLPTGQAFDGSLSSNQVAIDFAAQLPLTLSFDDYNRVEKVATLERQLALHGVSDAEGPGPGEIGYYLPTRGFVLYYDHVGAWPGLVRIGRFDFDLEALRDLPDGTDIQIAAVGDA